MISIAKIQHQLKEVYPELSEAQYNQLVGYCVGIRNHSWNAALDLAAEKAKFYGDGGDFKCWIDKDSITDLKIKQ